MEHSRENFFFFSNKYSRIDSSAIFSHAIMGNVSKIEFFFFYVSESIGLAMLLQDQKIYPDGPQAKSLSMWAPDKKLHNFLAREGVWPFKFGALCRNSWKHVSLPTSGLRVCPIWHFLAVDVWGCWFQRFNPIHFPY